MAERKRHKFLFSGANRFLKGVGNVIPLNAGNTELHSMKSSKAFLKPSPGQVLSADGAGVFIGESQEGNAKGLSRGAQHPGLGEEVLAC